jgi:ubiquinone/menaquinone biosynthesis C-methylase UbiE
LAKQGHLVTALDLREDMLAKAQRRAAAEDAPVTFVQGSITELPFPDDSFDVVLAESVTIFADVPAALREYRRVLRPEGILYDREILTVRQLTEEADKAIRGFYKLDRLYSEAEWIEMLRQAGFRSQQVIGAASFPLSNWNDIVYYPDLQQPVDSDAYENEAVWETAKTYDDLMVAYHENFGFGLMRGVK